MRDVLGTHLSEPFSAQRKASRTYDPEKQESGLIDRLRNTIRHNPLDDDEASLSGLDEGEGHERTSGADSTTELPDKRKSKKKKKKNKRDKKIKKNKKKRKLESREGDRKALTPDGETDAGMYSGESTHPEATGSKTVQRVRNSITACSAQLESILSTGGDPENPDSEIGRGGTAPNKQDMDALPSVTTYDPRRGEHSVDALEGKIASIRANRERFEAMNNLGEAKTFSRALYHWETVVVEAEREIIAKVAHLEQNVTQAITMLRMKQVSLLGDASHNIRVVGDEREAAVRHLEQKIGTESSQCMHDARRAIENWRAETRDLLLKLDVVRQDAIRVATIHGEENAQKRMDAAFQASRDALERSLDQVEHASKSPSVLDTVRSMEQSFSMVESVLDVLERRAVSSLQEPPLDQEVQDSCPDDMIQEVSKLEEGVAIQLKEKTSEEYARLREEADGTPDLNEEERDTMLEESERKRILRDILLWRIRVCAHKNSPETVVVEEVRDRLASWKSTMRTVRDSCADSLSRMSGRIQPTETSMSVAKGMAQKATHEIIAMTRANVMRIGKAGAEEIQQGVERIFNDYRSKVGHMRKATSRAYGDLSSTLVEIKRSIKYRGEQEEYQSAKTILRSLYKSLDDVPRLWGERVAVSLIASLQVIVQEAKTEADEVSARLANLESLTADT